MDRTSSFGYWLRRRRKALDLTQAELAQQVSCSLDLIQKIEADARRPSRQLAERLADCLDLDATERVAFVQAARAERAVDRLAIPAQPLAPRQGEHTPHLQPLKGYELSEPLGSGGFGVVHRAIQPGVGRDVAIKIIRPEYANHPEFIRRFEVEAQLVIRLEHPHIVPLYDYWREPDGAYLVMRYIRGGSLHAALMSGAWPLEQTTRLLDQIGGALAFAHRHGVVHRDLKPANILLDEDGNAYLADFGIAKDLRAARVAGETQPGAIVGSPAYLSPEQLRDEPVTTRSDIYSLGVLLYELLTGANPFEQPSAAEQLFKQLHEPLPPIQSRRSDLSAALNAVIQRATAKVSADRYPDVVSLVIDWQRAVVSSPSSVVSGPVSTDDGQRTAADEQPTTDAVTLTDLATLENPYKGLRAFGEADAADFFGRAALTQRLLERLAEEAVVGGPLSVAGDDRQQATDHGLRTTDTSRFLAVVGPSGSGKSSVVRAGLIPALRRGGLPDSEQWFVIEMLPGAHPLEELEAALLRIAVNPPPSLLEQLQADERGLARAVKRVLPADRETELVLVIDQFEELFTLTDDESVRAHFLASLRAAVLDPHSRLRVVATLRADFYDRPLLYADFGDLVRQRTEVVLPLTPEELEQAIVGPAARVGVALAPDLVAAIVQDVGAQPGTLPLLQYALTELFERRDGLTLTLAAYRASGGVRGALARRADEAYRALDAPGQAAARQLFLRLVTLGEGVEDTRRRVPRTELDALVNDDRPSRIADAGDGHSSFVFRPSSVMETVIDRYGRARLLSFDRDPITRGPTVEVAHEALLREWGRLRAWLDASRADIRMQRLLTAAAAEWTTAGRDPSYLLSGARLAQFEGWVAQTDVALTADERAFLGASLAERAAREAAEREQQLRELEQARVLVEERTTAAVRLRRRAILLAGALVLALGAALAAGVFARTAQNNFARSERLRLAGEANAALDRGESGDVPALLAIRSLQYGSSPQVLDTLRRAMARPFTRQRFIGHADAVYGVAFSPDGKQVLTGGADRTARLWDAATGRQLRVFSGHTDVVRAVAFSPDGKQVLTGSADKIARLWDVATGQQLRQFKGHFDAVWSVAFSSDGQRVLTGGRDLTARLWDVATGQQLRRFPGSGAVGGVAFSPDGKQVAIASQSGSAQLWDAATGKNLLIFLGHTAGGVNGVAFSPDGTQLISAGDDHTARLWNVQTGQELRRFEGHTAEVDGVAFSPDGKYVLTASRDQTARLWDAATGQQLRVYSGHTSALWSVAFSPDGKEVLTASTDGTARLWDTLTPTEPQAFIGHTDEVHAVAFSPDGKEVLTGSADKTARLWDAQTGRQLRVFTGHTDVIWRVAFSPDGKYVLTGGDTGDRTARLWDAQTGRQLRVFQHGDWVSGIALSPDGQYMFTGSGDGTARIWNVAAGQEVRRINQSEVDAIALSPDGKYLLTGSADQIARLYEVATGQQLRVFRGHTDRIWSVAFSPDGKYVLTGSDSNDATARLWDAQTGQQLRVFSGHSSGIPQVAFSPDGKDVLTGSFDGTARLWDAQTGQQLHVFRNHTGAVFGVAFSPDGKEVLTGSGDRTALLWHLDDQDLIQIACAQLPRDLTAEERATYSITDDAPTCPRT